MKKIFLLLMVVGTVSVLSNGFAQTGDPCVDDPAMCDPCMEDPMMCDPCMGDPACADPCMMDPAMCDPCMMDPAMCDPCMADPSMCGDDCLATGTAVMLSGGGITAIESITSSQHIASYEAHDRHSNAWASTAAGGVLYDSSAVHFVSAREFDGNTSLMYELVDSFGNTLRATANHPIITANRGAVAMASLQDSDTLVTVYGESTIVSLDAIAYEGTVHNLALNELVDSSPRAAAQTLQAPSTFFANNILVGDIHTQRALASR